VTEPGRIRLATVADAAAIAAIYRPYVETTAISFETEPPDDREMAERISGTLETHPWLVCLRGPEVAGFAYASRHRARAAYQWSVDVSAYVDGRFHRRGIGRALYSSLFAILAAQGFTNAFAGIALPNAASVGLHEALGFRQIGVYRNVGYKLGAWRDVGWWQLTLRDYSAQPPPLRKVADVVS
jgi:L-amino acid N-acyltransferase YncA